MNTGPGIRSFFVCLAFGIAALHPRPAEGALKQSPAECEATYGKPVGKTAETTLYKKGEFAIEIKFANDVAVEINCKWPGRKTDAQIYAVLLYLTKPVMWPKFVRMGSAYGKDTFTAVTRAEAKALGIEIPEGMQLSSVIISSADDSVSASLHSQRSSEPGSKEDEIVEQMMTVWLAGQH